MDSFSFEKLEYTLNTPDIFWSKDMKHIVMEYGQVKLIAPCVLNFFLWLQSRKLSFEFFPVSVSSLAEKVHHKKLNFNPKAKKKSPYCV